MRIGWKLFQICCCLQLLLTGLYAVFSFFGMFEKDQPVPFLIRTVAFCFLFWLPAFGLSTFNRLYPDQPVTGKSKKLFNRLFIINFLLSAFLFGLVFSELGSLSDLSRRLYMSRTELPFAIYIQLISYLLMIVFHFLILYGLYSLRLLLNYNFRKKKFEFED
jgi:hypothetical protein